MVLEVAILNVRPGQAADFESAFAQAEGIISSMSGYRRHELQPCIETPGRYLLLVWWRDLESHTVGFRQSPEYLRWKQLLHHFYDPFPEVEHYPLPDNEEILREFIERVWNRGEVEAIGSFVAPEYIIHSDPGDPWQGQTLDNEAYERRVVASRAPFPDLHFDLLELMSEGDRIAVSWRMRGTHSIELAGNPATGRRIDVAGMTIYDFCAGRVTGHHQVVDRLSVLQQLDLLNGIRPR